jgi:hypothetical protein
METVTAAGSGAYRGRHVAWLRAHYRQRYRFVHCEQGVFHFIPDVILHSPINATANAGYVRADFIKVRQDSFKYRSLNAYLSRNS